MTLDQAVAEAAQNAADNGYTFASARDMAVDMCTCCADVEREPVDKVEAVIHRLGLFKEA